MELETASRKMPIGIQDFEDLRVKDYVYVDKTAYIWKLATEGKPYFLSRPRRFGKSLLISTLKAYFQGKKALFDGLAIAKLETEWQEYPVLHFDFSPSRYDSVGSLNNFVANCLKQLENDHGLPESNDAIEIRFQNLIRDINKKTGKKVVVLVDEYDKPLLESMANDGLNVALRAALKPFYGVLKSMDAALRFVMLTGVTRFSKVSIFSDLNQLREIGMHEQYAGICGITETELLENFRPELEALSKKIENSFDETLELVRRNFNGYCFAKNRESVYNPFSLLNTFAFGDIQYYWFATGTPTFLFRELKRTRFDISQFNNRIEIAEFAVNDYQPDDMNPIPLLYQSGYLTIKDFDKSVRAYRLGFPNYEVKYGFLENLFRYLFPASNIVGGFNVITFTRALNAGEADTFLTQLKAFFAAIPYDLYFTKSENYYQRLFQNFSFETATTEKCMFRKALPEKLQEPVKTNRVLKPAHQTIFYLVFTLLGQFVGTEVRSAVGRADAVVKTKDTIYVFEFKLDGSGTAEGALRQIDERGYALPYQGGGNRVVKVGIVFDKKDRTLSDWSIED